MNDLYWLNAHAGKRLEPYPSDLEPIPPPTCPGCNTPMSDERGKDGMRRIYCSDDCRRSHTSRLQYARMEAARQERRLAISPYNWD